MDHPYHEGFVIVVLVGLVVFTGSGGGQKVDDRRRTVLVVQGHGRRSEQGRVHVRKAAEEFMSRCARRNAGRI